MMYRVDRLQQLAVGGTHDVVGHVEADGVVEALEKYLDQVGLGNYKKEIEELGDDVAVVKLRDLMTLQVRKR